MTKEHLLTWRLPNISQPSGQHIWSIFASIILIAGLGAYYWQFLSTGSISRYDEYLTLDRSLSIIRYDDWFSIYLMDELNFNKPPLHYWLTAFAIKHSNDLEFALRIWPYIEGLSLIFFVGVLAYSIKPSKPFVMLLAIIMASGSKHLWTLSTSAMLDSGDALFFTMTLSFLIISLRNPKCWYLVALSIALGAFQKSPLNLLTVIYVLSVLRVLRRYHNLDIAEVLKNNHFRFAMVLALFSVIIWPFIQVLRNDLNFIEHYYLSQIIQRFTPSASNHSVSFVKLLEWIVRPNPLFLSLGLLLFPLYMRLFERHHAIIFLSVVITFLMLMGLASGPVSKRYTLLIEPVIYAYLSVLIAIIIPNIQLTVSACLVAVFLTGNPLISAKRLQHNQLEKYYPLLEKYAGMVKADDIPVLCQFDAGIRFVHPVAFKRFAIHNRQFILLTNMDDLKQLEKGSRSILGLCTAEHFSKIKSSLNHPAVLYQDVGHLVWRSD